MSISAITAVARRNLTAHFDGLYIRRWIDLQSIVVIKRSNLWQNDNLTKKVLKSAFSYVPSANVNRSVAIKTFCCSIYTLSQASLLPPLQHTLSSCHASIEKSLQQGKLESYMGKQVRVGFLHKT